MKSVGLIIIIKKMKNEFHNSIESIKNKIPDAINRDSHLTTEEE